ncbi:hypothetical protein TNCV_2626551 [Trichonephila clavipes]|uniref:Uncharacterized protein n=1 Tax=Trichonephila clavipes TaxID=2585209 RepID=A0A8X6W798_TRICX|nr:hypothetical protein TNCV_2626551 [Trichonephila clavipes]
MFKCSRLVKRVSAAMRLVWIQLSRDEARIVAETLGTVRVGPCPARRLLATDHVILNHGQVTWTTPELASPSPNYHTTPTGGRFSSRQMLRASLPYTAGL